MAADHQERYRGKPFLRLMDAYVLWAIGELPRAQRKQLRALEPNLAQAYGHTGQWYEIVPAVLGLPDGIEMAIRDMWRTYQAELTSEGLPAEPLEFAHMFVDTNWTPPA